MYAHDYDGLETEFKMYFYNFLRHSSVENMYIIWGYIYNSLVVKNLPAMWETQVWSLGWEDPLEKEWLPITVFFPGEFYEQRSIACYSPWGCRESDTTEAT